MKTAIEISQALNGKRSGDGFMVLCPAHNDKNPSLSIKMASNGKLLWKCFAGCSQEEVKNELKSLGFLESRNSRGAR